MQGNIERLIELVYKKWKSGQGKELEAHPDEEVFACLLEDRLLAAEAQEIISHILSCNRCAEILATQLKLEDKLDKDIPKELIDYAQNLLKQEEKMPLLEIALSLKEKAIELLNTTGDVLVGLELVPAPVLRGRSIKDFKDEVTILKDLKDISVEVKIENKAGKAFNLTINAKEKNTRKLIKDVRVTLFKEDLELESYLSDSGSVTFEHVLLGNYRVEISTIEERLGSVLLQINA